MSNISLPVGKDDFTKLREENYYYIDKTLLIKHIVDTGAEVTLITRPRRFGKSLNMSMLDCFFDITRNDTDKLYLIGGKLLAKSIFQMQNDYI